MRGNCSAWSFDPCGFAQVNAVVGGTVADASGAVMPRVQVTATNVNTGIVSTRTTNDAGNYQFPSFQPGTVTFRKSMRTEGG
jgi:hypothetical protein